MRWRIGLESTARIVNRTILIASALVFLLVVGIAPPWGAPPALAQTGQNGIYFPPPGESLANQIQVTPDQVGLDPAIIGELDSAITDGRWALWRHGYLVHLNGDFNERIEIKSARKTIHAMTVGAGLERGLIPTLDQPISVWNPELSGLDADATWFHVITQVSAFDEPSLAPGSLWAYSDANPLQLNRALARVWGRSDYTDNYDLVLDDALLGPIGATGWSSSTRADGIRLSMDLEDLGRVGLLMATKGLWDGTRLISEQFVDQLTTKQTAGIPPNYDNDNDGHTGLLIEDFPESPYGFMTWVNTAQDLYPAAAATWAVALGATGHNIAVDPSSGVVLAALSSSYASIPGNPPGWPTPIRIAVETIQQNITGPNPLLDDDTTPPTAPTALSASPVGQSIQLNWTAAVDPESGISSYNIYRGTQAAGPKALHDQVPTSATSYLDSTTAPSTTYFYEVTAVNGAQLEGPASNEASALAGDDAPSAPAGLTIAVGDAQLSLDWADNVEPDLAGYRVGRSAVSGGPYTEIAGPLAASNYLDAAVTNGTTYYYVVTAEDTAGNVSAASTEVQATPGLDPSLVAHWRLDEGAGSVAADSVGSSNGTVFGATWGTGVSGAALDFDGSNDYVAIDNTAALDITGTQITLAAWIHPRDGGASGGSRVISKRTDGGGSDVYSMYTYQNRLRFRLDGNDLVSSTVFTPDQWMHVVMVYDGVDKRIYIDGVLDPAAPQAKSDPINASSRAVHLGIREGEGRRFDGLIDEVLIYDRALSATEVADLFIGVPPPPVPVLATIAVSPAQASLSAGQVQAFSASGTDQFGDPFPVNPTWTASGGTIDQSGNYTAGATSGSFAVTATDGTVSGNASVTISGSQTGSPPVANAGGPYGGNEGDGIPLDGSGSSDPDADIAAYDWDLDDDGLYDDASGVSPTFTSLASGTFPIALRVTDAEGASDTDATTVTVNNVAPTADAGGPYSADQGGSLSLDGSASSDPGDDIVAYDWDLDNDGLYDDATGAAVAFDTAAPGVFTVGLRVTDADGASGTASAGVTVNDTAPSAPAGLTIAVGDAQLSLDWADNVEPDLAGYRVGRSAVSGGPYTEIAGPLAASNYLDAAVTNGTTYYYVVTAEDTAGNVSAASTEVQATPGLDPSLVAHWRLDEGAGSVAADSVGSSNGTVFGATWGTGVSGAALDFDGSNDYVAIDNTAALDITGTQITLAAWIHPHDGGASGGSRVISKRTDGGGSDVYSMYTYQNRLRFRLDGDDLVSSTVFTPDQWMHVVMVYDGVDKRIYIDGVLDPAAPQAKSDPINASSRAVHLGIREGEGRRFDGLIDEVLIYDRALSATEVADLFIGVPPPPVPVLATIAVSPAQASLSAGQVQAFSASGTDQFGDPFPVNPTWTASGGTIDQSGNYTAGATSGSFAVTATDGTVSGNASVTISGSQTGSPPVANAGGPYGGNEGDGIPLDGSGSSDPDADIAAYDWDLDDDGLYDDASGVSPTFTSLASGTFPIALRVTDAEGASDTDATTVTVNNVAPTADAGGPYSADQGGSLSLDGSASSDPGDDIVAYDWDLDNDGLYDDATGAAVAFDTAAPGVFTVGLRVTDADGASGTASAGVTVNDTAPSAPAGLTIAVGDAQLSLDWADNVEPDLAGYRVGRSAVSGGPYTEIAGPLAASNYLDAAVTNGTTYYYVVTAEDTAGNVSAASTEVQATPGLDPSLVAHWRLDEGAGSVAADSVGSSNGTVFGATWGTGVSGAALDFDGSNDYVAIDNTAALDITGTQITLAAWIHPRDGGASGDRG